MERDQYPINGHKHSARNCIVEYGAATVGSLNANLQFENAPFVLLTNCTVRSSLNDAIFCSGSSPRIANCLIANNGRDGVRTANASNPVVTTAPSPAA